MAKRKPQRRRRKPAPSHRARPAPRRPVELERSVPANPEAAERVLEDIMHALEECPCLCGDADEIRLALREALNNAVRHGSRLNPRKRVHVRFHCDDGEGMTVSIRDEGAGFDPAQIPDPTAPENLERFSGRGLFMIRELMDEVEYRQGGREVVLRRRPRPAAESSS